MTEQNKIDLSALRQLILKLNAEEKAQNNHTELLVNPNREKVKKLNPKFCSDWKHLELDSKINRLIEYTSRFAHEKDLSDSTSKKVRQLLVKAIVNETVEIEFDESLGIITKIPKLYYSDDKGYYLGTYLNNQGQFIFRISKISQQDQSNDTEILTTTEIKTKPSLNLKK